MRITFYGKQKAKKVRKILWESNRFCHWCKRETVLLEDFKYERGGPKPPPNMATIEHLYSRLSSVPRKPKNEKVIACEECNQKRARLENKIFKLLAGLGYKKIPPNIYEKINARMKQQ